MSKRFVQINQESDGEFYRAINVDLHGGILFSGFGVMEFGTRFDNNTKLNLDYKQNKVVFESEHKMIELHNVGSICLNKVRKFMLKNGMQRFLNIN